MKNGRAPCYAKLICDLLGWSNAAISRATGCHPCQVSRVLHGSTAYPGTRKKVLRTVKLCERELFDEAEQTFERLRAEQKKEVAA